MTGSGDPRLEVLVLGPVELCVGDEPLRVGRRMERALAVRLALARGRAVPDEAVARDLWSDDIEPDRVAERLRVLSHRLRKALGGHGSAVRRLAGGYSLDAMMPDADALDDALGRAAASRRTGEPKRALSVVTEALSQWRGPALADLREVPFALVEADRLDALRLELQVQRAELELELGIDVTTEIERLVIDHPLDERLTGLAAVALYRAGRQADALDRLSRLKIRLAEELGVDPSPATAELELRILRQDASLQPRAEPDSALPELPWLTPRDTFVGRGNDLDALLDELDRPGLVTIVGGPGAGKTLLAREVAIALQRRGRPVAWCDLASVTNDLGVVGAVAAAAGVDPGPADPFPECAVRLEGALLVVDNAEHLVDAVANLAKSAQWKTHRLSMLVTSQRPLRLRNEQLHHLGPLDPESAAALFRSRCRGDLVAADDARVDTICAAVDRMPLGIELAAGLTRTLTLDQLMTRINHRLRLLVAGNRDSGARHYSLRAAIDRSHALLDPPARTVLDRLAVFAGGFTLEAAEEVAGGNGVAVAEIPVILADLHERSLLTVANSRYLLLESIREYARERLDDAVRREHARWCADLAGRTERYGGADHADLDRELRAEEANLRTAIEWTLDRDPPLALRIVTPTWWYWWSHGLISEGRDWLHRALAASDPSPTTERAMALRAAATLTRNSGDFTQARRLGEEALAIFRELGDERGYAASMVGLCISSLAVRDFSQAMIEGSDAASRFRALGNERLLCTALNVVGGALRGLGRTAEAGETLQDVCDRWRAMGDPRGLAGSLCNLALVRFQQHVLSEALDCSLEAIRIYRQINLTEGVIDAVELIAGVEVAEGRPAAALRLLTVAALERTRIGAPQIIPDELDARDAAEAKARRLLGISATDVVSKARAVPLDKIADELTQPTT